MTELEFDYDPPRQLADNLWEVRGEWSGKLGRRMTVVRLRDGRLVLHSSIRVREPEMAWLESLGTPAFVVAPNVFHASDAGWMARRLPSAELFVPASKRAKFRRAGLTPRDVNADFPPAIADELECLPMCGTRIAEAAFVHHPSRTLILCDLAMNMPDVFSGLERTFMRWNGVAGRFGPTRITKLFVTRDRAELLASFRALLERDFERVVVAHGDVVEQGGREKLRAGIEEIFGAL